MPKVVPVILSGGSGTRLWPKSRKGFPKQLHRLFGDQTMLQQTLSRLPECDAPIVVCNDAQRFMVADQITQVSEGKPEIVLEPVGRNTCPAIIVAALLASRRDPTSVIAVFPADHLIQDKAGFEQAINKALVAAETGKLVTFGIVPTHAETGYGYIKATSENQNEVFTVEKFVEKPDKETAESYVASGDYYWNSGMFVFPVKQFLEEMKTLAPMQLELCEKAVADGSEDLDFLRLQKESFEQCEDISIDYALMEKTKNAWVLPLDVGWSDVGSWEALWQASDKDENGNAFVGDVLSVDSSNCYVSSENRLVSLIGVEDLVVVETPDAVLVAKSTESQKVKDMVSLLKNDYRSEYTLHREVHRPWGSYDSIDSGERFQVKRIVVKPGASLSLQMHHHRAEHWIVVTGTAVVQKGEDEVLLSENQSIYIPLGEKHRLTNPGKVDLHLIEVQSGSYLGEDDIVRFEDTFGRA